MEENSQLLRLKRELKISRHGRKFTKIDWRKAYWKPSYLEEGTIRYCTQWSLAVLSHGPRRPRRLLYLEDIRWEIREQSSSTKSYVFLFSDDVWCCAAAAAGDTRLVHNCCGTANKHTRYTICSTETARRLLAVLSISFISDPDRPVYPPTLCFRIKGLPLITAH